MNKFKDIVMDGREEMGLGKTRREDFQGENGPRPDDCNHEHNYETKKFQSEDFGGTIIMVIVENASVRHATFEVVVGFYGDEYIWNFAGYTDPNEDADEELAEEDFRDAVKKLAMQLDITLLTTETATNENGIDYYRVGTFLVTEKK